jgi:hypothetical protein
LITGGGPIGRGSAVRQLALLIPRFADGSDRRQEVAASCAAFSIETSPLKLCPWYKLNHFTHVPSPMSGSGLASAMK